MWAHAEVLEGLASILGSAEQDDIAARGSSEGQLVKGQAFTAGLLDPCACGRRESECGNGELGDGLESVVIGDGADDRDGLASVGLLRRLGRDLADDSRDGHGRSVYS